MPPFWQIWIDTGGTFTDGVALAPDGSQRRVKLLSTGALRGTIRARLGPDRFAVRQRWPASAELAHGLRFRLLDREHADVVVTGSDPGGDEIRLSAALAGDVAEGTAFEVVSDEESPVIAARLLTGTPSCRPLPPALMRLGTTLGTNTLLQRSGVPTALFITRGFGDLLEIGNQQRPDLFSLRVDKAAPLYDAVVEVSERLGAGGEVLDPLDAGALDGEAQALLARGIRVAAVACPLSRNGGVVSNPPL